VARTRPLTPAECLARLPEPNVDPVDDDSLDDPHRLDLRRSILARAGLDHAAIIAQVGAVVAAVRREEAR